MHALEEDPEGITVIVISAGVIVFVCDLFLDVEQRSPVPAPTAIGDRRPRNEVAVF